MQKIFRREQLVLFSFKEQNKEECWVEITEKQIFAWHMDIFLTKAVSKYNELLPWWRCWIWINYQHNVVEDIWPHVGELTDSEDPNLSCDSITVTQN
jgi:hypothetical protein